MGARIGFGLLVVCAACLPFCALAGSCLAADPLAYESILRSRSGAVTPERTRDAQTAGGFIQVLQIEPNQVLVLMRGAVAAGTPITGSCQKGASASRQFDLNQDFEIVPTRGNLRPPRLFLSAWLIGSLVSSQEEKGGSASQAPACATILSGGQSLLNVCIKPHSVAGSQNLLVNDRVGPLEMTVAPGGFCLQQTFAINASQPKYHCHSGAAAAEFDPDPRLDSRWNDVLKPFRAAPHQDFGFRIILQVVEEPPPSGIVIPETLHRPSPEDKEKPAVPSTISEP
jgi:hypothetical protein